MNDEELRESVHPTDAQPGEPTGNATVDDVLSSLEGLVDRPVEEHVAVFERAHDRLRAALSDAGRDDATS